MPLYRGERGGGGGGGGKIAKVYLTNQCAPDVIGGITLPWKWGQFLERSCYHGYPCYVHFKVVKTGVILVYKLGP